MFLVRFGIFILTILSIGLLETFAQTNKTLRINPDDATGGTLSQYFDSVQFIPLETNKTSLFGDIHKLLITNDGGFLLSDDDTQAYCSFDSAGQFLARIDQSTYPKKTNWLLSAALAYDGDRDAMVISNPNDKEFLYLDRKGNILGHSILNGLVASMDRMPNNISFIFHFPQGNSDSVVDNVKVYKDSILSAHYLLCKIKDIDIGGSSISRKNEFYHSDNYTIFSTGKKDLSFHLFSKNGLEKSYRLLLPEAYSYPLGFDSLSSSQKAAAVNGKMKLIGSVRNIFLNDDWLFFELMSGSGYFFDGRHLMYNLKDGRLICIDHIASDSMSSFMPFHSEFGTITAVKGDYIYCYVPAFVLFEAKKEDANHLWEKNRTLKLFFETSDRKSNPVIIKMKLKQNL
ncbi:MAG: hypothetical protein DI598_12100 [Pseudopedobacter saltans]|uniref:6-bladed beta-propeller n=1 Tax=Pseudopedobacter saltans TaxID=151895 RepID=A0A2W5EQV7_9SPHI|nr:MAG: hypothetical protein DI598_12100 [Pseudopedobacter saltans]